MGKYLWIFFVCINLCAMERELSYPKKLVIHMDVNKTIIAQDSAGGKTPQEILIHSFADSYKDCWDKRVLKDISYSDYVKRYLVPEPKKLRSMVNKMRDVVWAQDSKQELKKKRNKYTSAFLTFLEQEKHPFFPKVQKQMEQVQVKLKAMKSPVFVSFFALIKHLQKKGVDFSIILRSFGKDLALVRQEIETHIDTHFFSGSGHFEKDILHIKTGEEKLAIENYMRLYEIFRNSGHLTIKDDYAHWHAHREQAYAGKKFPIRMGDHDTLCLFFDDNIVNDPFSPKDIVCPSDVTHTPVAYDIDTLVKIRYIIPVDPIQALLDDDYFKDKVENSIRAHNLRCSMTEMPANASLHVGSKN